MPPPTSTLLNSIIVLLSIGTWHTSTAPVAPLVGAATQLKDSNKGTISPKLSNLTGFMVVPVLLKSYQAIAANESDPPLPCATQVPCRYLYSTQPTNASCHLLGFSQPAASAIRSLYSPIYSPGITFINSQSRATSGSAPQVQSEPVLLVNAQLHNVNTHCIFISLGTTRGSLPAKIILKSTVSQSGITVPLQ